MKEAPASPKTSPEEQADPRPLIDLDAYRSGIPMDPWQTYRCRLCSREFVVGHSSLECSAQVYPRLNLQLCHRCFIRCVYAGTLEGRAKVEALLARTVPAQYQTAEFGTYRTTGSYASHLASVRSTVLGWARSTVQGGNENLYLYSQPGHHGTGSGNGKSHLAWASFKYVARRTCDDEYPYQPLECPLLACVFTDVRQLVQDFRAQLHSCEPGWRPSYRIPNEGGGAKLVSFDEYRTYLGGIPVLFLDDVGQGECRGLLADTYDVILDLRASNRKPTFLTSNFDLDSLDGRIGSRAASRVVRTGCQVIEVRAPDYARAHRVRTNVNVAEPVPVLR